MGRNAGESAEDALVTSQSRSRVWIHAVSAGEVVAAVSDPAGSYCSRCQTMNCSFLSRHAHERSSRRQNLGCALHFFFPWCAEVVA